MNRLHHFLRAATMLLMLTGPALAAPPEPAATPARASAINWQERLAPFSALRSKAPSNHMIGLKYEAVARPPVIPNPVLTLILYLLWAVIVLVLLYTARHYYFTLNRLFGVQRHPYLDIDTADWPTVDVLVPAHNEEDVIADCLQALLEVDYPAHKMRIIPLNDRSTDRTAEIIDAFVARYPGRIVPLHRSGGTPGKAAALLDASSLVTADIMLIFDADYLPGRGLIRQLSAPFFDPEVGAVMGRVVPINTGKNLLTRLLDMERSGGYQVDQQARMNLHLVPQYGGTVGGVRRKALEAVGGWRSDVLAEDTDLTYRLLLKGWKTAYENRSECYEEVPEDWPVRVRQIMRWTKGHNEAAYRYAGQLMRSNKVTLREKWDGLLLLGVFAMSPILLFGWVLATILFYFNSTDWLTGVFALLALMSYSTLGNMAVFFEIGAAVYLDGSRERIRLMPLNYLGFLVSLMAVTKATLEQFVTLWRPQRALKWDKTARYRQPGAALR
jgi:cellulose synthase/poly-beta-1,6-N-acetylglucosamine synthase-like glycosyltransferase